MKKRLAALFCVHLYNFNRTNCKRRGKSASNELLFNVGEKQPEHPFYEFAC